MAITLANEISYNEVKKTSLENDQDVVRYKNTDSGVYFYDSKTPINSKGNTTTIDSFLKDNNFITCNRSYSNDNVLCLNCISCHNCDDTTLCLSCQHCTSCTSCESCTTCNSCTVCTNCTRCTACASCNGCQPCAGCYNGCHSYN